MTDNIDLSLMERLDQVYTPIDVAREEIWKRWNDKALRKKVEEFIGGVLPGIFVKTPRAVLGRSILSPNFETIEFLKLANNLKLDPVCFGYLDDKIINKNLDKYYLCKLYFDGGIGKKGGRKLSAFSIINFNEQNGSKIREVHTTQGKSFVDFHLRFSSVSGINMDFFDGSNYLKKHGGVSQMYYKYFLALFMCHGILLESYLLSDDYRYLTENIFYPNYKELEEYFGLKPLIVRLSDKEKEESTHWRFYPMHFFSIADNIMYER